MPAIKVENLSKSYLVGHNRAQAERYTALRDVIARNARDLARKTRDMIHGRPIIQGDEVEEFWALKDINFEIEQGDRVGIIGRNGAGKSTLLKILSRITEPTTGRITLNGRVASLLEVGTGFHPELSGRENIFLNGAILGMSRKEIQQKFDEIVNFSEVEKFLDTPVKRYSSGMYVRLAFAVAAHLDPEILVVDEVLAVGDAGFQKKCLQKMDNIAKCGRTVLFVSHNIAAIQNLCNTAILLQDGALINHGEVNTVSGKYLSLANEAENTFIKARADNEDFKIARINNFSISSSNPKTGEPLTFDIEVERFNSNNSIEVELAVTVYTIQGLPLMQLYSLDIGKSFELREKISRYRLSIDSLPLSPGQYNINLWLGVGKIPIDWLKNCFRLSVSAGELVKGRYAVTTEYPVTITTYWNELA